MWNPKISSVGFVVSTANLVAALTLPHPNDGFAVFPRRLPQQLLQQRALSAGTSDENEAARQDDVKSSSKVLQMGSFLASKLLEKAVIEATREENDKVTLDDLVGLMESFMSGAAQRGPDKPSDLESFSDQDQSVVQEEGKTTSAEETIVSTVESNDVDETKDLATAGMAVMLQSNAKENLGEQVPLDRIRLSTASNSTMAAGGEEVKTSDVEVSSSADPTGPGSDEPIGKAVEEEMSSTPVTTKSDTADSGLAIDSPDLDGGLLKLSEQSNVESQADSCTAMSTSPEYPGDIDGGESNVTNLSHDEMGQLSNSGVSDGDGAPAAPVGEAPMNRTGDSDKLVDGKPPEIIETSSISDEVQTLSTSSSNVRLNDHNDIDNLEARIPDIISREFGRPLEVIASKIPPLRQTYVRESSTPPSVSDGSTAPTPEPSTSSSQPPTTSLRSTAYSVVEKLHEDAREKVDIDSQDEMLMNVVDVIAAQDEEVRALSDSNPMVVTADRKLESPQQVYFQEADNPISLISDSKEKFFPYTDDRRQHIQGATKLEASSVEVPADDAIFETGAQSIGTKIRRNVKNLFSRRKDTLMDAGRSDAHQPVGDSRAESFSDAQQQPNPAEIESCLAERYGKMDLEERAFTILYDLGMIEIHPNPDEAEIENSRGPNL